MIIKILGLFLTILCLVASIIMKNNMAILGWVASLCWLISGISKELE